MLFSIKLYNITVQIDPTDESRVDAICSTMEKADPNDQTSRRCPFSSVTSLDLRLNSPAHLTLAGLCLYGPRALRSLRLALLPQGLLDDSLLQGAVLGRLSRSSQRSLRGLRLGPGPLGVHAVNAALGHCPRLRTLGDLDRWSELTPVQVSDLRREAEARNLDLELVEEGEEEEEEEEAGKVNLLVRP